MFLMIVKKKNSESTTRSSLYFFLKKVFFLLLPSIVPYLNNCIHVHTYILKDITNQNLAEISKFNVKRIRIYYVVYW